MFFYFLLALVFFMLYASFMSVKFLLRLKVTRLIAFLHVLLALIAGFSFLFLLYNQLQLSYYSLISLLFFIPAVIVIILAFSSLKSQAVIPKDFLVSKGIYACIRNPIYLGIMLFSLGSIFISFSGYIVLYSIILILSYLVVIKAEEDELTYRFGRRYQDYKKRVPSLVPKMNKALKR